MELASRGEHTALVEKIGKLPAASVPDLILCLVLAATGEEKTSADRRMGRCMEISPLTNGGQDGTPGDDRDSRSDRARPRREGDRRGTAIRTLHGLQPLVPKRRPLAFTTSCRSATAYVRSRRPRSSTALSHLVAKLSICRCWRLTVEARRRWYLASSGLGPGSPASRVAGPRPPSGGGAWA